jgi:hypothetical protein
MKKNSELDQSKLLGFRIQPKNDHLGPKPLSPKIGIKPPPAPLTPQVKS